MNAFSKTNLAEVTRLTRAGKLLEAVTLLQGGRNAPSPAEPTGDDLGASPSKAKGVPVLDMLKPRGLGGAWSLPRSSEKAAEVANRLSRVLAQIVPNGLTPSWIRLAGSVPWG